MVAKKKAAAAKAVAESEEMAAEAARGAPENDTATAGDWNAAAPAEPELPGTEPAGEYDPYQPRDPSGEAAAEPATTEELEPQPQGGALKRTRKAATPPVDMTGGNARTALLSYCERVERLTEEMSTYRDDIKEVFGEAKHAGFDVATLRKAIRRRAMDPDKRAEQDSMLDIYESAIQEAESSR